MVLRESSSANLGTVAPDFSLPATDENTYTLSSFEDSEVLVILFLCNHCPYVKAILERLNHLAETFHKEKVRFIGINSNDSNAYPEDSFENMKTAPVSFLYLHDESQQVAIEYGAVCTPDIFVFDRDRKLVYRGRLDDNWKDAENVTKRELFTALKKILAGEKITASEQYPSMGCSLKWKS